MSTQSSESPSTDRNFYLILVSEFAAPQCLQFSSPEEVADAVKEYRRHNKVFYSFVFEGEQWRSTTGARKYLLSPNADSRIPLFDEEDERINEAGLFD